MFSKGEIVKVKEDSELKSTYAFSSNEMWIVTGVSKKENDIQVIKLKYRDLPSGGLPYRNADDFYHISKISKRRKLLVERMKRKSVNTNERESISEWIGRLRERNNIFTRD